MRIELVEAEDFRNYTKLEIRLPPGLTIVTGRNGAGKTNILEAVYFLANLATWRAGDEQVLVREGCEYARLGCETVSSTGRVARIGVEVGGRGRGFINGKATRRRSDILGGVRATLFAPEDLGLIKGPPSVRRNYMDRLVLALRPGLFGVKSEYERVLKQRNALLRTAGGRAPEARTLSVWDAHLASKGAELVRRRREALQEAAPLAERAYSAASGGDAESGLAFSYYCSFDPDGEGSEEALAKAIAESRAEEIVRGVSLVGPHRDDLIVSIGGRDARTRASQGEQRTAALAMRLAEHDASSEISGEPGTLLLDDVFSELDGSRSRLLAGRLASAQAIVTAADRLPDEVSSIANLRLEVRDGAPVEI